MKKVMSAMFVACAVSVGVAAQEYPSTPGQQPQGQQPAPAGEEPATQTQRPPAPREPATAAPRSSQDKVTMSGCIQNAPLTTAGATGTAGATASTTAGPKFVLSNAKMAGAATGGSAVGTTGTAVTYRLDGEDKTISPHLNHQVEITGTVQTTSASTARAGSTTTGSVAAAGPMLKVESLKMVSATCPK